MPLPESLLDGSNRAQISDIVADGEIEADRSDSGRHLELLPEDFVLHKKNADGITTRAVWLDWEGNRDRYISRAAVPLQMADDMKGFLWKKSHGNSSMSHAWGRREFTAEMLSGVVSYKSRKGELVSMWLVSGCVLHRIEGACFGRYCCFRIVWPSGFDLILAASSPIDCSNWFEYICTMLCPPREVMQARQLGLTNSAQLLALRRASIRAKSYKELCPIGITRLHLKIRHSVCDSFRLQTDDYLFDNREALDPVNEARKWGLGYPHKRYSELPEKHYITVPSISPYSAAWEHMLDLFPSRHQEEVRRFLVAANYNVSRASAALRKHIDWRAAMFPLRPHALETELAKGKCYVHGLDHYGHPVIYYFTRRQDPRQRSIDEAIAAILYRIEQAIARLPNRDGKVTLVVIREGASPANRDLDLMLPLAKILEDNYPERLHACVVYPAGMVFRSYLSLAGGGLVSSSTIARVIPLIDKADIKYYIPEGNLMTELGGTDTYNCAQECARAGSAILMPPLWTLPSAQDYYPPPVDSWESKQPIGSFSTLSDGERFAVESKEELEWVCKRCSIVDCKLCRIAAKIDTHYGGWEPMDLSEVPDPSP